MSIMNCLQFFTMSPHAARMIEGVSRVVRSTSHSEKPSTPSA